MKLRILYFASLRDAAGCGQENIDSAALDARSLYAQMQVRYGFGIPVERLRVAVNGAFTSWDHTLADGDEVVFVPPVSGG